ncbi:hypothetical protein FHS18_001839 [Paenibacillus phyllosphaerae]|uniref:Xylose isomerase-like TIM barrel domain-containing protein n=1 Tax=Paenibacillus phyllosphaerae TaxID=274593 RepID=A0A7W5AX71_9BACL|nr:TIM barrel protein [Paenibacillus phyllosphaerae]MBB3109776.1 hypothetical protein [Paenibacillus phyllosphaerae]
MKMMIGQYGGFDEAKYRRDFQDGFYGIEACLFASQEDTDQLLREAKLREFRLGVHFPFHAGRSKLRDALLLSPDQTTREQAYALVEAELRDLAAIAPEYVLFHYPKPVILDEQADWDLWNFSGPDEYLHASEYSQEELIHWTRQLFEWLSAASAKYDFIPVLEFDAISRYIHQSEFLPAMLDAYPAIRLCLDTARLHLQACTDPNFDAMAVIRRYAKYAHVIHLSSLQVKDKTSHRHQPVLPELKPEDGWAPIEDYLSILAAENSGARILFEHRSDRITDEQLEQCYAWVRELWSKATPAPSGA